jgi:hypothetical protein
MLVVKFFKTLGLPPAAPSCALNSYTDLRIPAGTHLSSASPCEIVQNEIDLYAHLESDFVKLFYTHPKSSFDHVALGSHYKML